MNKALSKYQKRQIRILSNLKADRLLNRRVKRWARNGYDLSDTPFRALDDFLSTRHLNACANLLPMSSLLPADQPRLFKAIIDSALNNNDKALIKIADDPSAHDLSRFEANGWSVFLNNRSLLPKNGSPVQTTFQYWDKPTPPREILDASEKWNRISGAHILYNEATAKSFIKDHFGSKAAQEFINLWHPAVQSDLFRLYKLYIDGGLYCDADSIPLRESQKFISLAGDEVWLSARTNAAEGSINNGLIAAPPKDRFISGFLETVLRNIRTASYRNIYWLSGPGALTRYLYETKINVNIISAGLNSSYLFKQIDAPYKYTDKNWRVYEHAKSLNNEAALGEIFKPKS